MEEAYRGLLARFSSFCGRENTMPWFTLEAFFWAQGVLDTRAIYFDCDSGLDEDTYALMPFADFLNHSSSASVRITLTLFLSSSHRYYFSRILTLIHAECRLG